MSQLSQLHPITNRILDAPKDAAGILHTACNELYKALIQITGIDVAANNNRETINLDSGDAIGLTWAAMCIQDYTRTKRFMDGIYEATQDKLGTITGRPVHILYAGTGPFATLILPLTARFSAAQIQLSLLEVNELSFTRLQQLISNLGLEKYIHRIEQADATTWTLPAGEPVDIFITETMQQGLVKEPQVELCMNIVPQLPAQAIIIPEQITLTAALIDLTKRMRNKRLNDNTTDTVYLVGTVFTLNKETILEQAGKTAHAFPAKNITIPAAIIDSHPLLYLLTDITIYNQEKLLIDKSQLTLPLKLADLSENPPATISCQYYMGKNPGIQFNI